MIFSSKPVNWRIVVHSIAIDSIRPHLVGALALEVTLELLDVDWLGYELLLVVRLEHLFLLGPVLALVV